MRRQPRTGNSASHTVNAQTRAVRGVVRRLKRANLTLMSSGAADAIDLTNIGMQRVNK